MVNLKKAETLHAHHNFETKTNTNKHTLQVLHKVKKQANTHNAAELLRKLFKSSSDCGHLVHLATEP